MEKNTGFRNEARPWLCVENSLVNGSLCCHKPLGRGRGFAAGLLLSRQNLSPAKTCVSTALCAARGHVRRTSTFGSLSQLRTRAFLTWRLMGSENRVMSWAYHRNYLLSFIFLLEYILHSWYVQMKQNLWGLSEVSSIKNPKPGGDFQRTPHSLLWEIELKRALFLFWHWKGCLARPFSSSQREFNPFITSISVFVVKNHVPVSKGLEGCGWESMWQVLNESSYRNDVYLSKLTPPRSEYTSGDTSWRCMCWASGSACS